MVLIRSVGRVGRFSLPRRLPVASSAFVRSPPGPARASARARHPCHAPRVRGARAPSLRRLFGRRHGLLVSVEPAAAALTLTFVKLSVRRCVARALARERATVSFPPCAALERAAAPPPRLDAAPRRVDVSRRACLSAQSTPARRYTTPPRRRCRARGPPALAQLLRPLRRRSVAGPWSRWRLQISLPALRCALAPRTLGLRKSLPPANPGFSTVFCRPATMLPSLSLFVLHVREAGP